MSPFSSRTSLWCWWPAFSRTVCEKSFPSQSITRGAAGKVASWLSPFVEQITPELLLCTLVPSSVAITVGRGAEKERGGLTSQSEPAGRQMITPVNVELCAHNMLWRDRVLGGHSMKKPDPGKGSMTWAEDCKVGENQRKKGKGIPDSRPVG